MSQLEGTVRRFSSARVERWRGLGDHGIRLGPVVEKAEGGPLSAYYARFGKGASAALPAPYSEVLVVLSGSLSLRTPSGAVTAGPGDLLRVPEGSPGELTAQEETVLACVSVPAH
jgi:ethanolamine utilization protein EutQ (cupin superfamily)